MSTKVSSLTGGTIQAVHPAITAWQPTLCRCAQACQAHGVDFLDAPISGGPQKASDGTLTIMCGGRQDAYDKVKPILETMGSHVRLMGDHGAGTAAKLVRLPGLV